jgi:alkyldihydroxyacetonephosphate synthase
VSVNETIPSEVAELAELIGPHRISTHPDDLQRHARDRSSGAQLAARAGWPAPLPLCVARPHTTEQVAALLRWADDTRTPVVPYGGGSGVVDGISPKAAVVIEMRAMNEILELDEKSRLVRVQAGMLGADFNKALQDRGFMLGHEPQSLAVSTVGGWVATRATGQLSGGYGGIEDLIAGLEAVLPGGRIVRSNATPRTSTGPGLMGLLLGSEGTLGIVTEATLRLSPIPLEKADVCIRFEHMADGVAACRRIVQGELRPTVIRLYDKEDALIFLRNHPDEPVAPLMLLSFDGRDAQRRAEIAAEMAGGVPGNSNLSSHWWTHRNDAVDEFQLLMSGKGVLGPHAIVDTIEVAATWSSLRDLYHSMKERLAPEAHLVGCHLSHAYIDGACLYFTLASSCESDEAAAARLDRWWEVAMETTLGNGGTISHHHGIGRRKAPWMQQELGGWWDILVAVKKAVDPNGIMNPGALGL